jgi:DNA excision repair protein ERCC-6
MSALRHDSIIDAGDPDYALVEGEAERVAKQAVRVIIYIMIFFFFTLLIGFSSLQVQILKSSRRNCYTAEAGIPTWTGTSGAVRPSGPTDT